LKHDGNNSETTNVLTVSGIHSTSNTHKKDVTICLDESSPSDITILSAITLNEHDKSTPCYLPVVCNDTKDKSELILYFSTDKPHI
jgi:hypothetical protein